MTDERDEMLAERLAEDEANGWREPITIERRILRDVLDVATMSLDFGSGFLDDVQVEALRAAAEAIGIDPIVATPHNFVCVYREAHEWHETEWAGRKHWHCRQCRRTQFAKPEDA